MSVNGVMKSGVEEEVGASSLFEILDKKEELKISIGSTTRPHTLAPIGTAKGCLPLGNANKSRDGFIPREGALIVVGDSVSGVLEAMAPCPSSFLFWVTRSLKHTHHLYLQHGCQYWW
eukprot:15366706-Ditylum_brightwellii.AAC.3